MGSRFQAKNRRFAWKYRYPAPESKRIGERSNTGGEDCYARRVAEPGEQGHEEVLGILPRHRPNIETPRRARARATADRASESHEPESSTEPHRSEVEELERLARAGVRVAGGAAATGLKLAGRAISGLGRVVGRR